MIEISCKVITTQEDSRLVAALEGIEVLDLLGAGEIILMEMPCDQYVGNLELCKYHIGILFDIDPKEKLPFDWVWSCNKMDELWVKSKDDMAEFRLQGVTALMIVIYPDGEAFALSMRDRLYRQQKWIDRERCLEKKWPILLTE